LRIAEPDWAGTGSILIADRMLFVYKQTIALLDLNFLLSSCSHALSIIMFIIKSLSAVAILVTGCVARPTSGVDFNSAVFEKLNGAPVGWVKDSSAKLDKDATSITLKVHLVNQDMDKFHDLAMNVRLLLSHQSIQTHANIDAQIATPGHAQYGNHLDQETILAMIAPKQESSDLVMQWLTNEISSPEAKVTVKGDYVTIQASVNTIEKLLKTEYSTFGK
jgi:tripeptidyl-peptidase-1